MYNKATRYVGPRTTCEHNSKVLQCGHGKVLHVNKKKQKNKLQQHNTNTVELRLSELIGGKGVWIIEST